MTRNQILAAIAIIILSVCGCSDDSGETHIWHTTTIVQEDTTPDIIREEDTTPDVMQIVHRIVEEDTTADVVVIHETKTIIQEDTTPDVVTIYEYPSGPVPCLMLVEEGAPAMADSPISGLTAATFINPADLVAITQSGTSKKATADLLNRALFLDPRYGLLKHNDWINDEESWNTIASGTGSAANQFGHHNGRYHNMRMETGTTATGYAGCYDGTNNLTFGLGEAEFDCSIEIPDLSDASETFTLYIGFGDNITSADNTDGVYFRYSHGLSSGNWERCTADNGVRTQQSTGIAVAADTWTHLGIRVNAAGSSAQFLIDGVDAGSIATNIPSGSTRVCGPNIRIVKSVGTTERLLYADYFQRRERFTTAR